MQDLLRPVALFILDVVRSNSISVDNVARFADYGVCGAEMLVVQLEREGYIKKCCSNGGFVWGLTELGKDKVGKLPME